VRLLRACGNRNCRRGDYNSGDGRVVGGWMEEGRVIYLEPKKGAHSSVRVKAGEPVGGQ